MPPYVYARPSGCGGACPEKYRMTTQDINGTLFLICVERSAEEIYETNLGLGLGLGLGIPLMVGMILLYLYWKAKKVNRKITDFYRELNGKNSIELNKTPLELATEELTPESLNDFRMGTLSEKLKEELMVLRIKKGHDLTSYVKYAEICEQPELADWIYRMNPTAFPLDIHKKGHGIPVSEV